MRRRNRALLLGVSLLLCTLLLSACKGEDKTPPAASPSPPVETAKVEETPAPTSEPVPDEPSQEALSTLDGIRVMVDEGRCYEAFQAMLAFEETSQNEAELAACEELFAELDEDLKELEPESGTELERGFSVQGGCVLEVSAFSGPVIVSVTDVDTETEPGLSPNYVRFYVRQGESGGTHIPAGTYRVRYQVGYRWFGESDGFGEYCTEGELPETLYFDFYMDGQWASNAKYSITI